MSCQHIICHEYITVFSLKRVEEGDVPLTKGIL